MADIEEQYRILPPEDEKNHSSVLIMRHDQYDGITYKYGDVGVEEKGGNVYLNFVYEIQSNPDNVDTDSEDFRNFIGDILTNIIEHNMAEDIEQNGDGSDHNLESPQ